MKTIIMAGGKGTRIASLNSEVPKPMIPILGKPILEYQIDVLKRQGYKDITLIIGHLGDVIQEYFGDGTKYGVRIDYIIEKEPLGTAGALFFLKNVLNEDFLLINGDIIFDIDINRFLRYHRKKGGIVTLFTHPNSHPYDSGIIVADEGGRVCDWLHKEEARLWYRNRVNAGIHFFSPLVFSYLQKKGLFQSLQKIDLDRDILKPLIPSGMLYAYDSPEYVKDMGTPDRFFSVIDDIKTGKVREKNLVQKQKAIFLDRDGTINKYVGFLNDINKFELLPGVSNAIKRINDLGYLTIIVTNQPVIARGELSIQELNEIHNKMETLLGKEGAYVDAVYYCPHHPDKGFFGEKVQYKIKCECRKPRPGMIIRAVSDYNINLNESWMIGDSKNDVLCGKKAGCKTALISSDKEAPDYGQNLTVGSLAEFVTDIFSLL